MKKNYKKHISISNCICVNCGEKFPIPRVKNMREKGHIKDIWCYKCQKITPHIEIRDIDFI